MSRNSHPNDCDERDSLVAETVSFEHWKQRFDRDIVANVIDPDSWRHEEGLMRHYGRDFETASGVVDGEQCGASGGNDFRDRIDERELVAAVIDESCLGRIGEIDSRSILEHPSKEASLLLMREECGCDPEKGESCIICCVKISPATVCVIARTRGGDNLYKAEISDDQACRQGFLKRRELLDLRKAFFRNQGSYAVFQND